MAPSLSRIFRTLNTRNVSKANRHLPMLNTLMRPFGNSFFSDISQMRRKKRLMRWYKGIPELTAFVNKVCIDSTNRYHFQPVNPKDSGRNRIMRANKFSQEIVLNKVMNSQMSDMLITGDGFGWMGFLKDEDVRKEISSLVKGSPIEVKEKNRIFHKFYSKVMTDVKHVEGFSGSDGIDEDLLRPRKYRYVPSTTVEILFDQFDIKGYKHMVGLKEINFKPREIIHFTLMDRDGKPEGYTPVNSILVQLDLLFFMWQNMLSIHKNGGHPDKIFSLEDVNPNTPAYRRFEQQLTKYNKVQNRHGNLLSTGKLNVIDLNQLDNMQFKDLGLYVTGLIAMQWGIPRSSIPYIVGGTNTKDDTGGNTERGYWEVIKNFQETFSQTMNTQLWIPHFGVKIVFENPYMQLDIQREQAWMTKLNNIMSMEKILRPAGKMLTESKRLRMLDLTDQDVEELEQTNIMMFDNSAAGIGTEAQLSPGGVSRSDENQNRGMRKLTEQTNRQASAGKPTGLAKEIRRSRIRRRSNKFVNRDLKDYMNVTGKERMFREEQLVPLDTFIKIYNEDKAYHSGKPPRLLRRRSNDVITYVFKSSDYSYRVDVPMDSLEKERIKIMNLGGMVYDINPVNEV